MIVALVLAGPGWSQTATREWFVSPSGDDRQSGTLQAPLRSIQRAAQQMGAGDTCIIRAGTYRECIVPARSGSEQHPIVFKAYPGEAVYVTGTESVSDWKSISGGVYAAAISGETEQIFVGQEAMPLARWPNAPANPLNSPVWANAEEGSVAGSIRVSRFPKADLRGAWIKLLPGMEWAAWTRPLQECPPGELCFDGSSFEKEAYLKIQSGTPYYVAGAPGLIDSPGEWCLDRGQHRLLFLPPRRDPAELARVEIKRRELGFDLSRKRFVEVRDIRLFACSIDLSDAQNCLVQNCHLLHPTHFEQCEGWVPTNGRPTGLILGGSHNQVLDCSIRGSAGNGVTVTGSSNTIANCLIRKINYAGIYAAAVSLNGINHTLSHCTLSDSGRFLVYHQGLKNGVIQYNDVSGAGLLTSDCGSIYAWRDDGAGTDIGYNWVHDNLARYGSGIYLDEGCSRYLVHHNVCWANDNAGIRLNTPSRGNLIANNTVFENTLAIDFFSTTKSVDFSGTRILNNILIGPCNTALALRANNFESFDPQLRAPAGWQPPSESMARILQQVPPDMKTSVQHRKPRPTPPRAQWDFRPGEDSPSRGGGQAIEGLENTGDIGAYGFDGPAWVPGHSWGEPPDFQGIFGSRP